MPDLSGLSFEQARELLAARGLFLRTMSPLEENQNQQIGSQSVAPGTLLPPGEVITVSLINRDEALLGRY